MPFEIDQTWLIYLFAAASVVLFVESIYLLFFTSASYRSTVNRRLRLMKDQPNRENVLIQLRRERGLTSGGLYGMPMIRLNRLVLQSGLTIGFWKLAMFACIGGLVIFAALWWMRGDLFE